MSELNKNKLKAIAVRKKEYPELNHSYFLLHTGEILMKGKKSESTLKINSGGVKDVYKAVNLNQQLTHVIAVVKPEYKVNVKLSTHLQDIFLNNPNISVGYHVTWTNKSGQKVTGFISTYMSDQDMKTLLNSVDLPSTVRIDAMLQAIKALKDIHAKKICHFDVKPENFLASYPNTITGNNKRKISIKLSDFDFAKEYKTGNEVKFFTGTPGYIEPQFSDDRAIGGISNGIKADIYSLGLSLEEFWKSHPRAINAKQSAAESGWDDWSYNDQDQALVCKPVVENHQQVKLNAPSWNDSNPPSPEPAKKTLEHLFWGMTHPHRDKRFSLDEAEAYLRSLNPGLPPNP